MHNIVYSMKLCRNIAIAILTAGSVCPFLVPLYAILDVMRDLDAELHKAEWPGGSPFPGFELAKWFLSIGNIWLMIVIAFWAFVAACKLWPIKKKEEK